MKFYSHTNLSGYYTRAISLANIRSVEIRNGGGKSAIRFSVHVHYYNDTEETFLSLQEEESKKVYNNIVNLLNGEDA